jgi:hypothetical protein
VEAKFGVKFVFSVAEELETIAVIDGVFLELPQLLLLAAPTLDVPSLSLSFSLVLLKVPPID